LVFAATLRQLKADARLRKPRGKPSRLMTIWRPLPYHLKRDYPRALELLRQANELGPSFTGPWEVEAYVKNGLLDEALTGLENANERGRLTRS